VGQIPDPDYNPDTSNGLNYYYNRTDRLSLPNAPGPIKPKKKMLIWIIIIDILLVVFILWSASWNKQHNTGLTEAFMEHEQGRYVFKLSRVINGDFLEAHLAIRLKSDDNFRLSDNCNIRFSFESADATNQVTAGLLQAGLDLPAHIFSAKAPLTNSQSGIAIRAHCSSVGVLPPVELLLK
jgi:hypothetical protein